MSLIPLEIEQVIGTNGSSIVWNASTGELVYPAGSLVVFYNVQKQMQTRWVYVCVCVCAYMCMFYVNMHVPLCIICSLFLSHTRTNIHTHIHSFVFGRPNHKIVCVKLSKSGDFLIAGEEGSNPAVLVWDLRTEQRREFFGHKYGTCVCVCGVCVCVCVCVVCVCVCVCVCGVCVCVSGARIW
jgi:WD40 repeat protein